jgi:hypothetical protein
MLKVYVTLLHSLEGSPGGGARKGSDVDKFDDATIGKDKSIVFGIHCSWTNTFKILTAVETNLGIFVIFCCFQWALR